MLDSKAYLILPWRIKCLQWIIFILASCYSYHNSYLNQNTCWAFIYGRKYIQSNTIFSIHDKIKTLWFI